MVYNYADRVNRYIRIRITPGEVAASPGDSCIPQPIRGDAALEEMALVLEKREYASLWFHVKQGWRKESCFMSDYQEPREERADETGERACGVVYTPYFRHWRTGKLIFAPPGKVFRFEVDD